MGLWHMIPLAERYGISDDLERETLLMQSTEAERRHLKEAVRDQDAELDLWLAGPAASGPNYSPEYIAFSAMRMGADFV